MAVQSGNQLPAGKGKSNLNAMRKRLLPMVCVLTAG